MKISSCFSWLLGFFLYQHSLAPAYAVGAPSSNHLAQPPAKTSISTQPSIIPAPPFVNAKAYILIDTQSGKIIAEKNSEEKLPPASLTKLMTLYVVSNALNHQQIHLEDKIRISREAWKTGGSRMFVKEGQEVSIENLLKGIIVASGNDACVAMAEHLGGSEQGFTELMNQQAQALGMNNSHFTDSTGLPDKQLYTTAKDLAILGQALISHFPEYYHWYKQKWFTFNDIRQPNRNRLLWRNDQVDGVKTGHTDEAGFCLVSSAKRDQMRLLAVVLGSPSEAVRADDSERLLNYGFRFFETKPLYKENGKVTEVPIYKGKQTSLSLGTGEPLFVTIPNGQSQHLKMVTKLSKPYLVAPIERGTEVGELIVEFEDKPISSYKLYALDSMQKAGFFKRLKDSLYLSYKDWIG